MFYEDCFFDEGERFDVPELDPLERGQPEPDTALRRATLRLLGFDRGRLERKREAQQ